MNNFEAMAYTALAMKSCGFSRAQIQEVLNEMNWKFNQLTEQEAVQNYQQLMRSEWQ